MSAAPSTPLVTISEATSADEELRQAIERLLPQLSSSPPPFGMDQLRRIVASDASILFVARAATGAIVGTLTLAVFEVPTGVRAWVEDVIVDDSVRGSGIGAALVQAALERAAALGSRTVDLTSRPSREAANRLYQRMGFRARQTNVYRHTAG